MFDARPWYFVPFAAAAVLSTPATSAFASNLGYETNYAKDNQAFSRALLFNFLPFYHTGLRLRSSMHSRVSVSYMLTNGVQQTEEFNDFKSHQVSLTLKPLSSVSWTVNYYAGREQPDGAKPDGPDGRFTVFDTYASVSPAPAWTFGVDVNHTTNQRLQSDPRVSLTGVSLYAPARRSFLGRPAPKTFAERSPRHSLAPSRSLVARKGHGDV